MSNGANDKVALVTGGNSGIGMHTAIGLGRAGHRVVITSRDPQRGEAARAEIEQRGGSRVDCLRLDLSSFSSIHTCAEEVLERYDRLDLLVNNAGLVLADRRETAEGFEMTFGVNHLGHFLLTSLLLERLAESSPARVVNLSSDAHKGARDGLDFDDLQMTRGYSSFGAYCRSKLANIYFTRELARRYGERGIHAFAVHPGVVRSGFGRDGDIRGFMSFLFTLARPFMISPEKGAATTLHVATTPLSELEPGGYYAKSRPAAITTAARDDEAARRLWELSARMVASAEADRDTQVDEGDEDHGLF